MLMYLTMGVYASNLSCKHGHQEAGQGPSMVQRVGYALFDKHAVQHIVDKVPEADE